MGPLRAVPSRRGALFPPGSLGPVSPVLDPSGDRIATVEGAVAEFTWDEAEFERVARKYGITKLVVGYTLLGGGNVALMGVALTVIGGRIGPFLCGLGAVYVLYALWFSRAMPKRSWKRLRGRDGPRRLVFSEEGVSTHNDGGDRSEPWALYRFVSERDGWYLMGRRRRSPDVFVPRRACSSPRDEAVFRALVRSHTRSSLVANAALDDASLFPPPCE